MQNRKEQNKMQKDKTMIIKMNVVIFDPNTEQNNCSDLVLKFTCYFVYDPDTYGNGYMLSIQPEDKQFETKYLDIRYDTSFKKDNPYKYLKEWCNEYWTGANGAYKVKKLYFEPISDNLIN